MNARLSMLWFCGNTGGFTLLEQVQQGLDHYEKKYKNKPDLCLVHPADFTTLLEGMDEDARKNPTINDIRLRPWRGCVKLHALIGEDKEEEFEEVIRLGIEESRKQELDEVPA